LRLGIGYQLSGEGGGKFLEPGQFDVARHRTIEHHNFIRFADSDDAARVFQA
jgi:hypothetical protein